VWSSRSLRWARSRVWPIGAWLSIACAIAKMVVKLFDEIGPRYAARNGGYLRILKCGFRNGDNAPMAFVELLDQPEAAVEAEAEAA